MNIHRTLLAVCATCITQLSANAGLVSHYSFDDETANDIVGNNNSEKIVAAQFSADAPSGGGRSLDLTGDDYVKLPDTDFGIGATDSLTISMWVKYTSSTRGVVSILSDITGGGGDRTGVTFGISDTGNVFVGVIKSAGDEDADLANAGSTFRDITADQIVPTDEWVHLALTIGADAMTTYLNGVAAESYSVNPAGAIDGDGSNVTDGEGIDVTDGNGSFTGFGASGNSPEHGDSLGDFTRLFYDGLLDEVAIWDAALDAAGIQMLMNGTNPQDVPVPAVNDADNDGLVDSFETNTGVWENAENTGTDPGKPDTDEDGLKDGVETNTGVFVSAENTGTDPNKSDTDGDGVSDSEEIAKGSSPTDPNSIPEEPNQEGELISYWNFDEGAMVSDLVGANHGTVIEGATFSDSVPNDSGRSLDLTGDKAYVRIGAASPDGPTFGIDLTKSFTVSMWVNYESSERGIVTIKQDLTSGGGDRSGMTVGIGGGGSPFVGIIASTGDEDSDATNSGATFRDITTSQDVPTGEWAHLVATLGSDTLTVYVNGEPAEDYTVTPGGAIDADGSNVTEDLGIDFVDSDGSFTGFGASGNGPEHGDSNGDFTRLFYDGLLDDVAIWNLALSAAEVKRLTAGESPLDILTMEPFRITDFRFDPATRSATLTWNSTAGALYTLEESDDLSFWLELNDGLESGGEETSTTLEGISAENIENYYRIREQP